MPKGSLIQVYRDSSTNDTIARVLDDDSSFKHARDNGLIATGTEHLYVSKDNRNALNTRFTSKMPLDALSRRSQGLSYEDGTGGSWGVQYTFLPGYFDQLRESIAEHLDVEERED